MFNKDFYPTPDYIIEKMWSLLDLRKIKYILEPSAGKGDIVDWIQNSKDRKRRYQYNNNFSYNIDCIEKDSELQGIITNKGYTLIGSDFLQFKGNKIYDSIMMNPPFSNGATHLLKALELMKYGGQIVCLLNAETLLNPYSKERQVLKIKLEDLEAKIEFIDNAFTKAERKTSVKTALVYIDIPTKERGQSFVFDELEKAKKQNNFKSESSYLASSDITTRFIEMFNYESMVGKQIILEYSKMLPYMQSEFKKEDKPFSDTILVLGFYGEDNRYKNTAPDYNVYLEKLRLKYWKLFLNSDNITKLCTTSLRDILFGKLEELKQYDFNSFNIINVNKMINESLSKSVEDCILNLFDVFTYQSCYDEKLSKNIHLYNGWKTNKAFYVNKKVIKQVYNLFSRWDKKLDIYTAIGTLQDVELAYQYLDDKRDTREVIDLREAITRAKDTDNYKKIETTYFFIDFFKKGTCHITFKDPDLLLKFNIFGSQKKGWLPFSYGKKPYSEMNKEEQIVVDNFHSFSKNIQYSDVLEDKKSFIYETNSQLLLGM